MKKLVSNKKQNKKNDDEYEEYKEIFEMFDKDKKGTISASDISKILKNFGNPKSVKEVEEMINDMDTSSGDTNLNYEEFLMLIKEQIQKDDENDLDNVLNAFKAFDKDNDGKITNSEFKYLLSTLDGMLTDEEIDMIFKESDLDNDGLLDYEDFINFWSKK